MSGLLVFVIIVVNVVVIVCCCLFWWLLLLSWLLLRLLFDVAFSLALKKDEVRRTFLHVEDCEIPQQQEAQNHGNPTGAIVTALTTTIT